MSFFSGAEGVLVVVASSFAEPLVRSSMSGSVAGVILIGSKDPTRGRDM